MRLLPLRLVSVTVSALMASLVGMGSQPAHAAGSATPLLLGAQLHVLSPGNTTADVDRQLQLLAATGATSARVDVAWSSLQDAGPKITSWYAARLDYLVSEAARLGIRPVLTLVETPCWASSAPAAVKQDCAGAWWDREVTTYPPNDVADYAAAAAWVAARYADRIAALEVWNEPNYRSSSGWSPWQVQDQAGAYARLVRAAYPAVKAVAPRLPVLAGSMSSSDVTFLRRLYASGIQGSYDGLAVHPYTGRYAPDRPADPGWTAWAFTDGLKALHAAQVAAGDDTPLWITEFGWTTCTGEHPWCVSRDQQASYTASALRIGAGMPYVAAMLVYNLRDTGTNASDDAQNFGLVTRDYRQKASYSAVTAAFTAARAARSAASGTVPATPAPVSSAPVAPGATAPSPGTTAPVTAAPGRKGPGRLGIPTRLGKAFRATWSSRASDRRHDFGTGALGRMHSGAARSAGRLG